MFGFQSWSVGKVTFPTEAWCFDTPVLIWQILPELTSGQVTVWSLWSDPGLVHSDVIRPCERCCSPASSAASVLRWTRVRMRSSSVVPHSATPRTLAHQAPLSMGFPRQEYQSGSPCPRPGDLPNPGMEPTSPALSGGFFTSEPPGKPLFWTYPVLSWSGVLLTALPPISHLGRGMHSR